MPNTIQAAACTLLSVYGRRVPMPPRTVEWLQAICADPAFVGDESPASDPEPSDFSPLILREIEEIRYLAKQVIVDRQLGMPPGEHTVNLGVAIVSTSLAAAVVEFCLRMQGIAFDSAREEG